MDDESTATPILSDAAYDRLKFFTQVLLPGLGAFYFALAQIWGFPNGEEIVGTITALDVLLGLFLVKATSSYNKSDAWYDGYIPEDSVPPELQGKNVVRMKVGTPDNQ